MVSTLSAEGQYLKRPLAWLGFSFFIGLLIASFVSSAVQGGLLCSCAVLLVVSLCCGRLRRDRRVITVLCACTAALAMYLLWETVVYRPLQRWHGQTARLTVETLAEAESVEGQFGVPVAVRVIEGDLPVGTKLTAWLPNELGDLTPYDRISGEFELSTPSDSAAGQTRGYSKATGRYLNAYPVEFTGESLQVTQPPSRPWMYHILAWRRYALDAVYTQSSMRDVSGLMTGIAFGDRSRMSDEVYDNFCVTGVIHVTAVSGLHTTFVAQGLLALLLWLRVRKRWAACLSMGGVAVFVALTGFTMSGIRSGVMCILLFVGLVFRKPYDGINSLGFALLAITVVDPYAVNDVGLLLSAAATWGILALYPRWQQGMTARVREHKRWWVRCWRRPCAAVGITLCATLPILPIQALTFGYISLISPLTNLLVVWAAGGVMVGVWMGVLLSLLPVAQPLMTVALNIGKWLARYMDTVVEQLAQVPFAAVSITTAAEVVWLTLAPLTVVAAYGVLGRRGGRVTAAVAAVCLAAILTVQAAIPSGVTTVTLLRANNATALLLSDNGAYGLITLGERGAVQAAKRQVEQQRIASLDFWALPNSNDACAYGALSLSRQVEVDLLAVGNGAKARYNIEAATVRRRCDLLQQDIAWHGWRLTRLDGGYLYLQRDAFTLLVCPRKADIATLPTAYRSVTVVVFTQALPTGYELITAHSGVLCSSASVWEKQTNGQTLSYPLYSTYAQSTAYVVGSHGECVAVS